MSRLYYCFVFTCTLIFPLELLSNTETLEKKSALIKDMDVVTNPVVANLKLTSMCSGSTKEEKMWRIINPNEIPIEVEWWVYKTEQKGSLIAAPGESFFFTKALSGPNTTIIRWKSGNKWKQTVKAALEMFCATEFELSNISLSESLPAGAEVGTFTFSGEENPNYYLKLMRMGCASDNDYFTISKNKLYTNHKFNAKKKKEFKVRIMALNIWDKKLYFKTFTLKVEDTANPPTDILFSINSIDEFSPKGTVLGELEGISDQPQETLNFTLVDGDGSEDNIWFRLMGKTVLLDSIPYFQQKDTLKFRVQVEDNYGGVYHKAFVLAVNNLKDQPTGIQLSNQNLDELNPAHSFVGILSATDPNPFDSHAYTLVSGDSASDNHLFLIEGDSLFAKVSFDYFQKQNALVRIQATDQEGEAYSKGFKIDINNVVNPPTAINFYTDNPIFEDAPVASGLGYFEVIDPDFYDAHTLELVAGSGDNDNLFFSIVDDTLKNILPFNYDEQHLFSVRVRATDLDSGIYEQVVEIEIRDVIEEGSGSFNPGETDFGVNNSTNVQLGDFDADGDMDAFVSNQGESSHVWWNDGDGNFTNSGQSFEITTIFDVKTADIDGDGDLDILIGNWASENTIYLNNGNGIFSKSNQTLGNDFSLGLVVYDFDSDGDLDVVTASYSKENSVWLNDGAGNFNLHTGFGEKLSYNVLSGDFNADGIVDILELRAGGTHKVWLNDGQANFTDSGNDIVTNLNIFNAGIGDVDGDNDLDIVMANSTGGNSVWTNNGNGIFSNTDQVLGDANTHNVVLGDLDEDNDLDIIFANRNAAIGVWKNDGLGKFTKTALDMGVMDSREIALGNLDSDQDLDAFIVTNGQENLVWLNITPPSGITLSNNSVLENLPVNSIIGNFETKDLDVNDTSHYEFVTGEGDLDNGKFNIVNNQLLTNQNFNYDDQQSYSIRVRSTDSGGFSTAQVFKITVININNAPVMDSIPEIHLAFNEPTKLINLTGISDGDIDAQVLTFEMSSSNPDLLEVLAINYIQGDTLGKLSLKPALDQFGETLITLNLRDNGGIENGGIDSLVLQWKIVVEEPDTISESLSEEPILEDHSNDQSERLTTLGSELAAEKELSVEFYPNPTTGLLSIEFSENQFKGSNLRVVDLGGNVIVYLNPQNGLETIDISSFKPGIYLLKVTNGNQEFSKKIIKK
ncbi:FG-GAP-like repeat-containing protein [Flexithrix dorotheae]|uniref:FG-GAP-like repeat-containing protein n=1 Tax=Flexithrix dorotheae TaxID=70993 RepID=UPI0009FCAC6A|nr:FG-GAP-like repeat-containing protein [Flexithrix dorotheae]